MQVVIHVTTINFFKCCYTNSKYKKSTKYVLSEFGGKVVTREETEKACKRLGENARRVINFMISYGYLIRILRGLYYVRTIEEFATRKSIDTP